MRWKWQNFSEISGKEMHEILAVRQKVFVVEQQCAYMDADEFDYHSFHLTGRNCKDVIEVYCRLNYPGNRFEEPSIGRILTVRKKRSNGLAEKAICLAIEKAKEEFPTKAIRVSAQSHLRDFYHGFGFQEVGEVYAEDGIDHIDMVMEME